ncbi:MAG: trigger factor [Wujia sp.]
MKRNIKKMGSLVALTMGLTLVSGCGKKGVDVDKMVDKYAAYCELGEYKGVEYEKYETTVSDDMIQSQINSFLSTYATSEQVTEGKVEEGDSINIDFVGTVDGVEFEGGSTAGAGYDYTVGSGMILFDDQLAGHEVGETFEAEVTFPEDYGVDTLDGRDAVFAVTINYITESIYPEYNDELIAQYTNYTTVEEFETGLRDSMQESYNNYDLSYNKSNVITVVMENSTIKEYPEAEMQDLIDEAIGSVQEAATSAGYDLGTYISSVYGMSSEDDFRAYVADLAKSYMDEKILICAIAKSENITVSKDEIDAQKELMLEELDVDETELYEHYTDEDIAYYALSEKVYAFLLDNGVPASPTDAE